MTLRTVKELALRLQVKDKTIYGWVSQGKIPCVKVNGVLRFDETEIEQWLQECHMPVGRPSTARKVNRPARSINVDSLIESAKREVYTQRGEIRPIASPFRKEGENGTR